MIITNQKITPPTHVFISNEFYIYYKSKYKLAGKYIQ